MVKRINKFGAFRAEDYVNEGTIQAFARAATVNYFIQRLKEYIPKLTTTYCQWNCLWTLASKLGPSTTQQQKLVTLFCQSKNIYRNAVKQFKENCTMD